jgi:hypothetical protein
MTKITLLIFGLIFTWIANAQLIKRQVRPNDTDSTIQTFTADSHYVYLNKTVPSKGILVVHLPGTFGEPKRSSLFGETAADLGLHSIGLMYPNIPTVGSFCTNNPNLSCFELVRREIIEGKDYSSDINISPSECIINRLSKLLMYLHLKFPDEGWSQFLDEENNPVYERIIFSGHSQGGGHAALIAKHYAIKRALCFSSPKDWSNITNSPAPWTYADGWKTAPEFIYCFNHVLDEHEKQLQIWDSLSLNLFGPPVSVEQYTFPYQKTRQLTSSFNVPVGDEHASTIQDNKTPKQNGMPLFKPVWSYMLTYELLAGTNHIIKTPIYISPNPAYNIISLPNTSTPKAIAIYNHNGNTVLDNNSWSNNQKSLDVSNLTPGIYYLQLTFEDGVSMVKFIKQ